MNKFHRVDKLPCGECKQKFDSFDEMDLHHHLVHGRDGEFACDKCEIILNSADSIKLHMERVHGRDGEYACDHCGKTLNSADSLRMHMMRVHDELRKFIPLLGRNVTLTGGSFVFYLGAYPSLAGN